MVKLVVSVLAGLALLLSGSLADYSPPPDYGIVARVSNGASRGDWGSEDRCPKGTFATGFRTKMESYQGPTVDDSALNGIRLLCTRGLSGDGQEAYAVESESGQWGEWSEAAWCPPGGRLESFALRVEEERGSPQDRMGATGVRFFCSGGEVLQGPDLGFGEYGTPSAHCPKGFCGIQTRVESPQGVFRDDSALTDAQMLCCTR
ncbi:vitelline membrane outer layer protein 1 homolog [Anolis carolinensis]|uniref:vitelline membrane outer layer protein 1 homolog n=1 Tax=Anolis carolinensis TaxID=28377 RepID=UPI002F2B5EDD